MIDARGPALFVVLALGAALLTGACGDGAPPTEPNRAPTARIARPGGGATLPADEAVAFDASGSSDPDGTVETYAWEFGDGGTAGGRTATHAYAAGGEFTVALTVEDDEGATDRTTVEITVNEPPSASIAAPADGAMLAEGQEVTFEGSAEDPEDGPLTEDALAWRSDADGELGTGETVTVGDLSVGEHAVTLEATDGQGASAEAGVAITVEANEPPSASIDSPADGAVFSEGEQITFEGSAEDPEEGALMGDALAWRSDSDGQLGTGATVTVGGLSVGEHVVTLEATDSRGAVGEATVSLTVEANEPPAATIAAPADGATIPEGQEITFEGSAEDPEDGTLAGDALVWRSDSDGQLGTGATVTVGGLSVGEHVVTLEATDSQGARADVSITVTVEEGNAPPTAAISSPSDGAVFGQGQTVTFEGSGDDPEDGTLTGGSLVWRSSLEGQLGTGTTVSRSDLSVGTHAVTLEVTDADGSTDQASVTVTVETNDPPSAGIDQPAGQSAFDEGTSVTFEGSGQDPEDGSLTGGSLVWSSDADGQLGTGGTVTASGLSPGPHTVTLTATDSDGASASSSVEIVVEGSGYDIRVRFLDAFTAGQRSTIRDAVSTWESVITGDLSPGFPSRGGACDEGGRGIDDLLVSVRAVSIDGGGGTLARAGPCVLRSAGRLPIAGVVRIDEADLDQLGSAGLSDLVEHEVGHVVGIGVGAVTGWGGGVRDVSTLDPYFAGASAVAEFEALGGEAYLSDPVPLANQGGSGTRGAHWREANLQSELMTGFISTGGTNPLSAVTVGAIDDIGYAVDPASAEAYALPMPQGALWEAAADATLARPQDAATNFGTPDGSDLSTTLVAGTNADEGWEASHPDDELYTGLLRFGVPSLPSGVSLNSAEVLMSGRGSDGSGTLELVRVTGGWSEGTVSWDGRPSLGSAVASFGVGSCCGGATGALTDLARGWADGSVPNRGLALRAPDAGSGDLHSAGFATRHAGAGEGRPLLRVTASTGGSAQASVAPAPADRARAVGDDLLVDIPLHVLTPDGETRRIR